MLGVTEKAVWQAVLRSETGLNRLRVGADTQNYGLSRLKLSLRVAERDGFNRSARGIGLRIKEQDHRLPTKVGEAYKVPLLVRQRKRWRRISYLEHGVPFYERRG